MKIGEILMARYISNNTYIYTYAYIYICIYMYIYMYIYVYISSQIIDIEKTYPISH